MRPHIFRNTWIVAGLIAGMGILLAAAGFAYQALNTKLGPQSAAASGSAVPAPDFQVTDESGKSITLSGKIGKPVIVNAWASWCTYCREEMPLFEKAYQQYGTKIDFMMVDLADGRQETVQAGKAFISEKGYTFPVLFDTGGSLSSAYNISGIPVTLFVRADGSLLKKHEGAISESQLAGYAKQLLE